MATSTVAHYFQVQRDIIIVPRKRSMSQLKCQRQWLMYYCSERELLKSCGKWAAVWLWRLL